MRRRGSPGGGRKRIPLFSFPLLLSQALLRPRLLFPQPQQRNVLLGAPLLVLDLVDAVLQGQDLRVLELHAQVQAAVLEGKGAALVALVDLEGLVGLELVGQVPQVQLARADPLGVGGLEGGSGGEGR